MNQTRGLVNRILKFSAVDGPGNRFVVFLQGCNFQCINCHNPHTIGKCNLCGICVKECPVGALKIETTTSTSEQTMHYYEDRCTHCDRCIKVCPESSNPQARWMSVKEALKILYPVEPFLSGVTVSGGEATSQPDFVRELFRAIKADPKLSRLTTFIDSNGSAPIEIWETLIDVTDGAMIDLKALNSETHKALTGNENESVIKTIKYLEKKKKLYEVRLLIIPDYNDSKEQIQETAKFLNTINPNLRIKINAFRKHGTKENLTKNLKEATKEQVEQIKNLLENYNFKVY